MTPDDDASKVDVEKLTRQSQLPSRWAERLAIDSEWSWAVEQWALLDPIRRRHVWYEWCKSQGFASSGGADGSVSSFALPAMPESPLPYDQALPHASSDASAIIRSPDIVLPAPQNRSTGRMSRPDQATVSGDRIARPVQPASRSSASGSRSSISLPGMPPVEPDTSAVSESSQSVFGIAQPQSSAPRPLPPGESLIAERPETSPPLPPRTVPPSAARSSSQLLVSAQERQRLRKAQGLDSKTTRQQELQAAAQQLALNRRVQIAAATGTAIMLALCYWLFSGPPTSLLARAEYWAYSAANGQDAKTVRVMSVPSPDHAASYNSYFRNLVRQLEPNDGQPRFRMFRSSLRDDGSALVAFRVPDAAISRGSLVRWANVKQIWTNLPGQGWVLNVKATRRIGLEEEEPVAAPEAPAADANTPAGEAAAPAK